MYVEESIRVSLQGFQGITLNTMFEAFRTLILDIDENRCILSRFWLEDQQSLALAWRTGSVLVQYWKRDTWGLARSYSW